MRLFFSIFFLSISSFFLNAQTAQIIKLPELEKIINYKNDTTYIINFWATWCKPCVEELPYFLEAENDSKEKKVRFIFISLDFKRELETRLNPFLKNKKITSSVFLLDEPDYNKWIDLVSKDWEGNIPATLIYNSDLSLRTFYPHEFDREKLREVIGLP
ncbi:MAG: TlpA family protein disulfide reductase [Bacteroidota bacterium]